MQFNHNRIEAIAKHLSAVKNEVFIVSYARTPLATLCGAFSAVDASRLGAAAISGCIEKLGTSFDKADIDEVILGHVLQSGCGQAPARQAAIISGIPAHVPSEQGVC
jgi:acetyl-CoA C-acetyltransferase